MLVVVFEKETSNTDVVEVAMAGRLFIFHNAKLCGMLSIISKL